MKHPGFQNLSRNNVIFYVFLICISENCLAVNIGNVIEKLVEVISEPNVTRLKKLSKRNTCAINTSVLNIGNDGNIFKRIFRNLIIDVKASDGFNFVAKKIEPVRIFIRKRKNINNTSAHRKLAWLINIFNPFETIFIQKFVDKLS